MTRIAVLGAGSWGVALARSLANNGQKASLWEFDPKSAQELTETRQISAKLPGVILPDSVCVTSQIEKAVQDSRVVLVVVPSCFFRNTLTSLKQSGWPHSQDCILAIATKGLLFPGGQRLSQAAAEIFESTDIVVISGPSHAEEVGLDLPTALVAASTKQIAASEIQSLLMSRRLRIYTSTDVTGVETGGALKNVLAIATGISDGLGFGDNSRAALITRGLREIIASGIRLGGQPNTFQGLTGIGDLVVTCTSRHSRNRRFGEYIGKGYSIEQALEALGMVAEGYYTAKSIVSLEESYDLELPICREVYKILYEGKRPSRAVDDLMLRERKAEIAISKELQDHEQSGTH